jgi:integrase
LETHGFRIDPESRLTLLRRVEEATTFAALRMKRAADGDYSPDPEALRYPKLVIDDKVTIDDLYDRWVRESSPSPSTLSSWKKPLNLFKAHIGDIAVDALEPRHIVSWKDKLLGAGLDTRTINSTYLAAVRRWLQIGVDNQLLQTNAAKGILVAVSNQTSSQRRAYSDAEIARLLLSSIAAGDKIRWLIWLAVGTGARIGELAQLWGSSFRQIGGDWYVDISAAKDGGRLKNDGSERTIPLHGHLVSSGLPGYIAARGQGPLFYKRSSGNPNKKHASKGVANRTSAWVRDQGFAGSDLAPCHSIRHWWKTTAHRHGVLPVDADVFQGHSIQGVAHIYRHIAPEDLLRVVAAMPFPAPATSIAPADIG